MRVAIVTESFLPQINGVTNSVLRVAEFLKLRGDEAMIIAPESDGIPSNYAGFRIKTVRSIPVEKILPVGLPMGLPSRKLEALLDGFNPDVIHLASPMVLGGYAARIASKLKIPTVSIYQTDMAGFASHYKMNIAGASLRKLTSAVHSATSRTLAPSTWAISELADNGVENLHLWRRGVNSQLFHPMKRDEKLRESWRDYRETKYIVGFVGRLANEKRIYDLKVLDQNPLIQLVITGDGPAREKLEETLPNAIFTGFKSSEDLAKTYASFDLFVHTGPNETFCQAVQESLASGVPAVVPATGGPRDLVSHGITGYVINTHRPDELEAAVYHFFREADQNLMAMQARVSVEGRTWDEINAQLISHYKAVINENESNIIDRDESGVA